MILPLVGSKFMPSGWPDRFLCHRRWSGWLEFKDNADATLLQVCRMEELNIRQAGIAFEVDVSTLRIRYHKRVNACETINEWDGTAEDLLNVLEDYCEDLSCRGNFS